MGDTQNTDEGSLRISYVLDLLYDGPIAAGWRERCAA